MKDDDDHWFTWWIVFCAVIAAIMVSAVVYAAVELIPALSDWLRRH